MSKEETMKTIYVLFRTYSFEGDDLISAHVELEDAQAAVRRLLGSVTLRPWSEDDGPIPDSRVWMASFADARFSDNGYKIVRIMISEKI